MAEKFMSIKKWNKEGLLLRILTFVFKLSFQLVWSIIYSLLISFKWLKNGSQEIVYGDDNSASLIKIIEQNKIIIKRLNKTEL